jgi:chemotaxis protein methyltransferase CheR
LLKRVHALRLPSLDAYYRLLISDQSICAAEWQTLIEELTVNESYFFRDQGQFSLLRNHVLPELLQTKQHQSRYQKPTLRIWSAGCSTGEEAYSLAILLKELIPDEQTWNILLLGTDISELALEQAKRGIYNEWSFRSVNPELRKKYFRSHYQGWEVDPVIRSMVTFQAENLVQDYNLTAHPEIRDLDLIVCRNVFIYFDAKAIAQVLDRFHQVLVPNGYLMTGHTELHQQNLHHFQVQTFPESILYQRQTNAAIPLVSSSQLISNQASSHPINSAISRTDTTNSVRAVPTEPPTVNKAQLHVNTSTLISSPVALEDVSTLIDRKAYVEAIHKAKKLLVHQSSGFKLHYLMAEAYANLGDHQNAVQACHKALQLNPLAVEPIYLLAQIAQEQDDLERAKTLLKQVIYLAPSSVYAYFELGCLYEQQGNMAKAQRNWRSTLDRVKQLPQQATVDLRKNITAIDLQTAVEQKLKR